MHICKLINHGNILQYFLHVEKMQIEMCTIMESASQGLVDWALFHVHVSNKLHPNPTEHFIRTTFDSFCGQSTLHGIFFILVTCLKL